MSEIPQNHTEAKEHKVNGGEVYKETTREVSIAVNDFIQNKIMQLSLPKDIENLLLSLPKKREGKDIMRPTISFLVYKLFNGQSDVNETVNLLAISELNNYYCYLDNWILDDKNNIGDDKDKVRKITIASAILRELTQRVIEESTLPDAVKVQVSLKLSRATIESYRGQELDLETTVSDVDSFESKDQYIQKYLYKSELQSGFLYGFSSELGCLMANCDDEEKRLIEEIFRLLGTAMHVSNDLGDFAISLGEDGSFKVYQDQMADIVNGRLTLPSYLVITEGSENEKETILSIVGDKNASEEKKVLIAKSVKSSGAYDQVRKLLNDLLHKYKKLVHQLPEGPTRDAISSMGETVRYNKYLKSFKNL